MKPSIEQVAICQQVSTTVQDGRGHRRDWGDWAGASQGPGWNQSWSCQDYPQGSHNQALIWEQHSGQCWVSKGWQGPYSSWTHHPGHRWLAADFTENSLLQKHWPEYYGLPQVLSIVWLMSPISKTLMNGSHMMDQQMMSGMTSVLFMRIFMGMLFVPQLSSSTHFVPQNKVGSSYTISTYCISSSLWYWYVIYDLSIPIIFFFCPFDILWYKFLSYREVLHVLPESSELSKLSELIELPEVFSSMEL